MSRVILYIFGIIAAFGLALALFFMTSLWLVWLLLPATPAKVALSLPAVADTRLFAAMQDHLPDDVAPYIASAWRLGFTFEEARTLVVIPTLRQQRFLSERLRANGWQVTRFGLVLVAHREVSRPPQWLSTGTEWLTTMISGVYPLTPAVIFTTNPDTLPGVNHRVEGVVALRGSMLHAQLLSTAAGGHRLTPRGSVVDPADTVIHLPGEIVQALPSLLKQRWNETLRTQLAFSLTRPHFIEEIEQASSVTLYQRGSEAAVAVHGHPGFVTVATAWIETEERHGRLETHAFRLPDGTLGYEKVPGTPEPVLSIIAGKPCREPVAGQTTLWLCSAGEHSVLATSQAFGEQQLAGPDTPGQITMGERALKSLRGDCQHEGGRDNLWCGLRDVQMRWHEESLAVQATLE